MNHQSVTDGVAALTACPAADELRSLLAGLAGSRHDELEFHVQSCAECSARLAALVEPSDDFIRAVHVAGERFQCGVQGASAEPPSISMPFQAPDQFPVGGGRGSDAAVLGDFRLIRQIGRGGMGIVYEAEQISLGRPVALKTLQFTRWTDDVAHERFQNEARAAALLEHPHIVPIYSVGDDAGMPYFTMKLIVGQDLGEIIRDLRVRVDGQGAGQQLVSTSARTQTSRDADAASAGGFHITESVGNRPRSAAPLATPLSQRGPDFFRAVADAGSQVADALAFAHDRGVLHRDVKPSNLLIDKDAHVWVADFGLAQIESAPGLTATSVHVGTPRYMSPERALGGRGVVDHRSDIYSLGATLYELLALTPVFGEAEGERLLSSIAMEDPVSLRNRNREIPRDLALIVETAIAKSAQDRYATAQDMAADLRRFLAGEPIAARPPRLTDRAARWLRRHPVTLGAAVAAMLAFVVLAGVLLFYTAALTTTVAHRDRTLDDLRDQVYSQDIAQAAHAIDNGDTLTAASLLSRHVPQNREPDTRGFEWHLLDRRCRGDGRSLPLSKQPLYAADVSASGRWVVAGGQDGILHILDAESFSQHRQFDTQQRAINDLAISPDESLIATGGDDGAIHFWSFDGAKVRSIQRPQPFEFRRVQFTPDGGSLVSTGDDSTIRIWDARTGELKRELVAHTQTVVDIDISRDGNWLVSGSSDATARIWSLRDGSCTKVCQRDEGRVVAVGFSPDGDHVASATANRDVRIWNLSTDETDVIGRFGDQKQRLCFLPNGSEFASADRGGVIRVWSLAELAEFGNAGSDLPLQPRRNTDGRQLVRNWLGHTGRANDIVIDSRRNRLVTVGNDGIVRCTQVHPEANLRRISVAPADASVDFSFTPDERMLVLTHGFQSLNGSLSIYEPRTGSFEQLTQFEGQAVHGARISPDGRTLAVVDVHRMLHLLPYPRSARGPEITCDLTSLSDIAGPAFTPDCRTVVAYARCEAGLIAFDRETGERLKHVTPSKVVGAVRIAPSGDWMLSHADGLVTLTSLNDSTTRKYREREATGDVAISPDEATFAVGGDTRAIHIYDVKSGRIVRELVGHSAQILSICYSPDGRTVASTDRSGTVKLWHASSGRHLFDFAQEDAEVRKVQFAASGRFIAYLVGAGELVITELPEARVQTLKSAQ